jgi:hypothetical protein
LLGDGTQSCFLAIGVTCSDGKQCAYRLKIEQRGVDASVRQTSEAGPVDAVLPPGPILRDEYTNGRVGNGEIKYYYFPVNYKDMGESMILLNKTQIYGTGENGDSKMLMNVERDATGSNTYKTWVYPTDRRRGSESMTG